MPDRLTFGLAAALLALATPAGAGDIAVSGAQLRPTVGLSHNTAGYFVITNAGKAPDRLLSASCACAERVEAHRSMSGGGMAGMAPAGPVAVPAHGAVAFRPGGLHLMVTGLKVSLKEGAAQDITLRFERAGPVKSRFVVTSRIVAAPAEHHH